METTSYIALSRQGALEREMEMVAHNIANMNTSGFKGERMMFVQHLVKSRNDQSFVPTKLAFARDVAEYKNLEEGPINETGNTLNFAVRNDGYFVVQDQNGQQLYTRNGNFTTDTTGQLVTQGGLPVLSNSGAPIFFSAGDTDITVSNDGTISTKNGQLGKFQVVRFDDQQQMKSEANGLFSTDQSPQPVASPKVIQGAIEGSNVQPVLEISRMIDVHRAYESVKNFIDSEDQRQKTMIQQLTGTA
jgi:flagellar basal-body rod protein FlgF